MLGRKQELNLQFQQIIDGFLLVIMFWVSYALRYFATDWFALDRPIASFNEYRWVVPLLLAFGPIFLDMQGFYQYVIQKTLQKSLWQMLRAAFWLCLLVFGCVIFFRLNAPSRGTLILFGVIGSLSLLIRERISILYLRARVRNGRIKENVLLAGSPDDVRHLRQIMTLEQASEMEVVGEIDVDTQPVSNLIEALHKHSISRVIFAGAHSRMNRVQEAIGACEIEGVEAWLMADFIKTSIARPDFDVFRNQPVLVFRTTPAISWALFLKGVIDFIGALFLLVVTSPLFLLAAIWIKLSSPGPIIFRQMRSGKHGKPFQMYKFRSMFTDAEMRKAELEAFNEMSGPVFKVEDDPRVTPIGRFLRKTSIDELPQLVNVLQGHMSLVGPRPLPIYEVEKFENVAQRRRLSVKPGLTCLWQVSGRNRLTDFQRWVELDLQYIDNWSIWLDVKILLRTVVVVLLGFGAK